MPSAISAGNRIARTGPTPDQRWRYTVSIRPVTSFSPSRCRPDSMPTTSSLARSAIGAISASTAGAAAGRSPGMNTMASGTRGSAEKCAWARKHAAP